MNYKNDGLWNAVTEANLSDVRSLLRAGADPNILASDGWVRAEHAGKGGKSLLHHAVWGGNIEVFKALVEAGADFNARRQKNWAQPRGMTATHYAAFYDRPEILLYCLNNGFDVDMQGEQGHTCLHLAAKFNYPQIVQILLDYGARTEILTKSEQTADVLAPTQELKAIIVEGRQN